MTEVQAKDPYAPVVDARLIIERAKAAVASTGRFKYVPSFRSVADLPTPPFS